LSCNRFFRKNLRERAMAASSSFTNIRALLLVILPVNKSIMNTENREKMHPQAEIKPGMQYEDYQKQVERDNNGERVYNTLSTQTNLAYLKEAILGLPNHLREISRTVGSIHAGDELAASVLKSASIVFCTLTTAGNSIMKKNCTNIDVLVVDEAAQALEAELLIPLSTGPKSLIIVGDPKQLPATVISGENQRLRRGDSLMQRLIEGCSYPAKLLDTQYRMHPDISVLPNQLFYSGQLKDSDHVKERSNEVNKFTTDNISWLDHYSFIDIPGGPGGATETKGGRSMSNYKEATTVVR
jgi:hypothetical protein